ncbi:MAG TPA: hypothetical protein ENI94_03400 [Gammaproteobacteria bacterium]|nr:hypothetical protein [Gammaproteobacteria bacterium]
MTKNNVVKLEGRAAQADPLPKILIVHSRQLIAQAVETGFSATAERIITPKKHLEPNNDTNDNLRDLQYRHFRAKYRHSRADENPVCTAFQASGMTQPLRPASVQHTRRFFPPLRPE